MSSCPRCQGEGYLSDYRHIQGGLCFKCWGTGDDNATHWKSEQLDSDESMARMLCNTPLDEIEAMPLMQMSDIKRTVYTKIGGHSKVAWDDRWEPSYALKKAAWKAKR